MEYFKKIENNPYEDLKWNIPERKQGIINIIGGNAGRFRDEVKIAELIERTYPIEMVRLVLPEALRGKLPNMPNFMFLSSSDSGSFAESQELIDVFNTADYNLVLGDLSRNAITGKAIAAAIKNSEKTTLLTRDTIELISENSPERILMNENIIILASIMQLQKLLRSAYYPKMLLASSSLVQVVEVLHKFTLSYPISVVTLHNGQVLIAKNGTIKGVPLEKTGYSPMLFWNGEIAGKIAGMNLYNPNRFIEAAVEAMF